MKNIFRVGAFALALCASPAMAQVTYEYHDVSSSAFIYAYNSDGSVGASDGQNRSSTGSDPFGDFYAVPFATTFNSNGSGGSAQTFAAIQYGGNNGGFGYNDFAGLAGTNGLSQSLHGGYGYLLFNTASASTLTLNVNSLSGVSAGYSLYADYQPTISGNFANGAGPISFNLSAGHYGLQFQVYSHTYLGLGGPPSTGQFDVSYAFTPAATAGVPEPATWAMMLLGMGGIGAAVRRRPKAAVRIRFA